MNKRYMLFGVCILMFVFVANSVLAEEECCVLHKTNNQTGCSYWNMTGWAMANLMCTNLNIWVSDIDFSQLITTPSCATYNYSGIPECTDEPIVDGLAIPEFGTIAAAFALGGASLGYMYIRRKRIQKRNQQK